MGPVENSRHEAAGGLQHERTALAWERTSIATMVAGITLTRALANQGHPVLGILGLIWVAGGGALLWWSAANHALLHDPSLPPSAVPQVGLSRLVGLSTLAFSAFALVASIAFAVFD